MPNQYIIYINNPENEKYPIQHFYIKAARSKSNALYQLSEESYGHWYGLNNFVINYGSNVENYIKDPDLLNLYRKVTENTNLFGSKPYDGTSIERFIYHKYNDYLQLMTNEDFLAINPFFKILMISPEDVNNLTLLK